MVPFVEQAWVVHSLQTSDSVFNLIKTIPKEVGPITKHFLPDKHTERGSE